MGLLHQRPSAAAKSDVVDSSYAVSPAHERLQKARGDEHGWWRAVGASPPALEQAIADDHVCDDAPRTPACAARAGRPARRRARAQTPP